MKKLKIYTLGEQVLREKAKPVTVFHKKLQKTIDNIKFTLDERKDGAALAANQVGLLKRIVVIDYLGEYLELVNPEILESDGRSVDEEGCLSFPGYFGNVPRYENVKVKFQDRDGVGKTIERSGKMARCLQHEIDHLDGVLFIDRMEEEFVSDASTDEQMEVAKAIEMSNTFSS